MNFRKASATALLLTVAALFPAASAAAAPKIHWEGPFVGRETCKYFLQRDPHTVVKPCRGHTDKDPRKSGFYYGWI